MWVGFTLLHKTGNPYHDAQGRFSSADESSGGGVSNVVSEHINNAVSRLTADYPQVGKFVSGAKFVNSLTSEFDPFSKELRFSSAGLGQGMKEADQWINASNKPGFTVGTGLGSLVTHEFGHAVDHYIISNSNDETKQEWFDTKKRLERDVGPVSDYAKHNTSEWFAEQFTAEKEGYRSSALLPVIEDFLSRVGKK